MQCLEKTPGYIGTVVSYARKMLMRSSPAWQSLPASHMPAVASRAAEWLKKIKGMVSFC
jgi:hypothetical protein